MLETEKSLFHIVDKFNARRMFAHYRGALQTISYQIEDAVLRGGIHAPIFAGFQKFSFFKAQMKRYRELARVADGIWIFGLPDVTLPPIRGITYVPLSPTHKLVEEWFLVVNANDYFSALVAQDLSGFDHPVNQRLFRGIWTFDDTVVKSLTDSLTEMLDLPAPKMIERSTHDYRRQLNHIALSSGELVSRLERRNEELYQAKELREDLSHMLVHDLRSPLAVIVAALGMLEYDMLHPSEDMTNKQMDTDQITHRKNEMLSLSYFHAQRLNEMVGDLLDIAKLESGDLQLERSALSPFELTAVVKQMAEPLALDENKTLHLMVPETLPDVWAEEDKILRVLNNLLSNAIKYADNTITLAAAVQHNSVRFKVSDDGYGIPLEAQAKIFDKFQQAGGDTQRHGTGLGLTFCKMVVEAHGGQIGVESQPGQGSTFHFTLPLLQG